MAGQRWPVSYGDLGFKKLSLNNGQEDNPGGVLTALLSEHLAWRLMQREVPAASDVAYAKLYVELTDVGETNYHGLYILIEDIDRTALKRRWGGDAFGELLKTTTGSCRDQVVFADDVGANLATLAFEDWMALDDADQAGTWAETTDEALWLDELLRAEALRDVLANGADTVLGSNYSNYLSWDESSVARRHYLPWDLDDVFRPYPQDVPFDRSLETGCSEIGDRTRCQAELEVQYLETACQLINGTLDPDTLIAEWDAIDALLRPIIPDEVDSVWGGDDPLEADRDDNYQAEYERIRTWIADRIPEVRSQIEARGVDCPVGCPTGAVEACEWRACAGERQCGSDGLWTGCELIDTEIAGNGVNDDCDALIDEDDPTGTPGTTGPATGTDPTVPGTDPETPTDCDDPGEATGDDDTCFLGDDDLDADGDEQPDDCDPCPDDPFDSCATDNPTSPTGPTGPTGPTPTEPQDPASWDADQRLTEAGPAGCGCQSPSASAPWGPMLDSLWLLRRRPPKRAPLDTRP